MTQRPGGTAGAWAVLVASVGVFAAGATGLALRAEPFYTWYFLFAWWPFIAAGEALLRVMGGLCEPCERPGRFAALASLSVVFWLFYEALNFRLGNWHYIGVPDETGLRWAGYVLSFATVLPGLSLVRRLLEFSGLWEGARCEPWTAARRLHGAMRAAGAACLVLPMVWPRYCFPLVWGGAVLLLEPWMHARGGRSLLRDLALGRPRNVLLVLAAGAVCGGLWECWNYWSGAKWVYSVPFVGELKLFEMPVLGFLGFPPFALCCYGAASALDHLCDRLRARTRGVRLAAWALAALAGIVFSAFVMHGIDRFTVLSFG